MWTTKDVSSLTKVPLIWQMLPKQERSVAVYVHFPFCLSICPYCDFDRQASGFDRIDDGTGRTGDAVVTITVESVPSTSSTLYLQPTGASAAGVGAADVVGLPVPSKDVFGVSGSGGESGSSTESMM